MNNTPKYKKQRLKQAEDKEKMQAKISPTTEEAQIKLDKLSFIKIYNFC